MLILLERDSLGGEHFGNGFSNGFTCPAAAATALIAEKVPFPPILGGSLLTFGKEPSTEFDAGASGRDMKAAGAISIASLLVNIEEGSV